MVSTSLCFRLAVFALLAVCMTLAQRTSPERPQPDNNGVQIGGQQSRLINVPHALLGSASDLFADHYGDHDDDDHYHKKGKKKHYKKPKKYGKKKKYGGHDDDHDDHKGYGKGHGYGKKHKKDKYSHDDDDD